MASILMVASEGLPFIKTGGLADVIGSLPLALTEKGHEVKVVMPLYPNLAYDYSIHRSHNIMCGSNHLNRIFQS